MNEINSAVQQSLYFASLLNAFAANLNARITIAQTPGGAETVSATNIVLNPSALPLATGGSDPTMNLVTTLAHELAHAVLPSGNVDTVAATDPDTAAREGIDQRRCCANSRVHCSNSA